MCQRYRSGEPRKDRQLLTRSKSFQSPEIASGDRNRLAGERLCADPPSISGRAPTHVE